MQYLKWEFEASRVSDGMKTLFGGRVDARGGLSD
jgi:hypothetical protein